MSRLVKIVSITILFWIVGSIIFVGNRGIEVFAEVPHLINYQGRLTDKEGQPLEGVSPITFRIYDVQNGGVSLWQETQNVNIQKGVFNVLLGAVSDIAKLAFDKPYYLEIVVSDEVMSPRQRITSVGYALRAETADTIADPTLLVPQGAIIMYKDACPAGYKRLAELDNKFLVSGQSYNPSAGGTNTHNHGGNTGDHVLTIEEMPSHTHGWPTYTILNTGTLSEETIELCRLHLYVKERPTSSTGGNQAHKHTISSADNRPEFAIVVLCEKE